MSFNELVNSSNSSHQLRINDQDNQYKKLYLNVSNLIFETNSKISRIVQYVNWFGTPKDSKNLRDSVQVENQQVVDLFREIKDNMRTLSSFQSDERTRRTRNLEQQKLQRDLKKLMETFQQVQNLEASKSRHLIEVAKQHIQDQSLINEEEVDGNEEYPLLNTNAGSHLNQVQTSIEITENDVMYNNSMILEREREIEDIERGIVELNDIFKDIGTIVNDQQNLLDNIESNVNNVSQYTSSASNELVSADEYQRRTQKKRTLLIIFLVIIFMVLFVMMIS
ncbi:hypothetical protein BB560_000603 [Smittium megazygosporum]|uniref:t-SNARE coiled-coil homology domain-containing protein n=1 Tax=Smittium megazygosporum TaxID=133381 RepID=A0A2T9ZJZ2_9FUNG|nr:hypothetical protein BB560_000603 [Smittium megazygosporum]